MDCVSRPLFIAGITSKLQHFVDSGIGAIWLSPINQSPMIDFGYDISDFRNIDKIFGTSRDFEELVKRAKELGVRVIIVTNEEGSYFHINLHS